MIYLLMILFLLPTAAGLSMPFKVYTFSAAQKNLIKAYERNACPSEKVTCGSGFSTVEGFEYNQAFMRAYEGDKREFCEWFKELRRSMVETYATDEIVLDLYIESAVEEGKWRNVWYMSISYTGFKQC